MDWHEYGMMRLNDLVNKLKTRVMDRGNNNRVNMTGATIIICDANTAATAGITNFALRLADAKAKKILIDGMNQVGKGNTKGVTKDVGILKATMISKAEKCANATVAFANSTKNNTLKALVNYTAAKLSKIAKDDVDDVCQGIHDATDTNFAGAEPFGIVASDVTDLQAAIDLYRIAAGNTRQAIITRSQAIKQAKKMVRELIKELLVEQMDKMVNTIKETQNMFWGEYFQAREVIDLGKTTAKVRGSVRNTITAPLAGVKVVARKSVTGEIVKQTLTKEDGSFVMSGLQADDYNLSWELDGYETVTEENVHIAAGKEIRRKIVMQLISLAVAVRESDIAAAAIQNIDLTGVHGSEQSTITIVVTGGTLRFYSATNPTDGPGDVFFDKEPGSVTMTLVQFITLLGLNPETDVLNVENISAVQAHYKITINTPA